MIITFYQDFFLLTNPNQSLHKYLFSDSTDG